MPNPSGVPAFGGYFTRRVGVNTEAVYAYWADGSLAVMDANSDWWRPAKSPSFAALFPDRVTREPSGLDFMPVEIADAHAVTPLPFRGDLPAQPRPDDADDREYPARGGRDD